MHLACSKLETAAGHKNYHRVKVVVMRPRPPPTALMRNFGSNAVTNVVVVVVFFFAGTIDYIVPVVK